MKKRISLFVVCLMMSVGFSLSANAHDFGKVSGSWEATNSHWKTAGDIGVVCEHRNTKKPFKVKVYQRAGHLYQEFADFRFWPNSCSAVTTTELQHRWGSLGTIVEDASFNKTKRTQRRWFIRR